jgi:hypothetical protein
MKIKKKDITVDPLFKNYEKRQYIYSSMKVSEVVQYNLGNPAVR